MQVGQGERAQSREVTFGDGSWKEMPAGCGLVQTVGTYPSSYPCAVHGRWAEWLHLCSALLCTCGALTRPEGLDMEEPRQKKSRQDNYHLDLPICLFLQQTDHTSHRQQANSQPVNLNPSDRLTDCD